MKARGILRAPTTSDLELRKYLAREWRFSKEDGCSTLGKQAIEDVSSSSKMYRRIRAEQTLDNRARPQLRILFATRQHLR